MTKKLDRPPPHGQVLGKPVWFTRRRYGNTTFTWVHVDIGGTLHDLGDPWPCITPKRSEMEAALRTLEQSDDRLFIGVYPCAIVYADRWVEVNGDYARIATLPYRELELQCETRLHPLIPKIQEHAATIMEQRGQPFSISGCGQTVVLGR